MSVSNNLATYIVARSVIQRASDVVQSSNSKVCTSGRLTLRKTVVLHTTVEPWKRDGYEYWVVTTSQIFSPL